MGETERLTVEAIAELQDKIATQREVICNLNAMNDELQDKLDKIEQIVDSRDGFYLYDNLPPFQQIKEVLKND